MTACLHLLFLPHDADQAPVSRFFDATGRPLETLPAGAAVRRWLAVPATELALHRLAVAAATPAQAKAAALRQVQERLARPREPIAVVVASPAKNAWFAVFEPGAPARWLARAAEQGFPPDAMVPDCLLLPEPAAGAPAHVVALDGYWQVRGDGFAFSAEAALARQILDGRALERADDEAAARGFWSQAARNPPTLDLGAEDRRLRTVVAPARRRLAMLAAALLLSPVLVWAAQGLRHQLAADALSAQADAALLAVAPEAGGAGPALGRAGAALARRQAADRFGLLAAHLADAQAQFPGTRLSSLALTPDGVLAAEWWHDDSGQLERLRESLATRGIGLSPEPSRSEGGRLRTTLLLSDAR